MKFSKELRVGVFAIIAIAVFYVGFNYLKGKNFLTTQTVYYAIFDDAKGLIPSNPIVVNGVPVGSVLTVELDPANGNRVLVGMEVRADLPLPLGSTALLSSEILSSTAIVLDIKTGSETHQTGDTLASGVNLGLTDQITTTLTPVVDELDSTIKQVNNFLNNLNNQRIDSIFSEILATGQNLNVATAILQMRLAESMDGINTTLANLNDAQTGLKPILAKLNAAADTISSLELQQTIDDLDEAVVSLTGVIDSAQYGSGTLAMLINDSTLYTNINTLSISLDSLVNDVNDDPKKYLWPLGRRK
ncbi:MAG: MlaD family protein [Bacteroidota bacterium]